LAPLFLLLNHFVSKEKTLFNLDSLKIMQENNGFQLGSSLNFFKREPKEKFFLEKRRLA